MQSDDKKLLLERLAVLFNDDLREECRKRDLPVSGPKDALVKRLIDNGLELSELTKPQLQSICFSEDLSDSGTKAQLLERLGKVSGGVRRKEKKEVESHVEVGKKAAVSASIKLISTSGGEAMVRRLSVLLENALEQVLR